MHVLWIFRLRCAKEKEACHAKLRDDISEFVFFLKLQCDALAISLDPFQPRTEIPWERM